MITWRKEEFEAAPTQTWLLGWLREAEHGKEPFEYWWPVWRSEEGAWLWGFDLQPIPESVELVAWAYGPTGPRHVRAPWPGEVEL